MLTRLLVRNFKTLKEADIELGQNVVFIGPNNSGKTSALQALALWQTGVREWMARREPPRPQDRWDVTINRRNLTHTPIPEASLLWRDKRVLVSRRQNGTQETLPILLDVLVEGQVAGEAWQCGLEFYYANSESFYCCPMPAADGDTADRRVPPGAGSAKIAFLPSMSGLTVEEEELKPGRVDVLVGEGQTARVLRNLCLSVYELDAARWRRIAQSVDTMFGIELGIPLRDSARGTIGLAYAQQGSELDITCAGRGLQQTLLLLAHMYANPGATLLLDEPDAHLEVLRQRQIYDVLTETARSAGSQLIMASHSEIILNEAADRDLVIGFVGSPHRINNQGAALRKALTEIGYEQYAQALQKPGVLYLEGATDLAMLRAFARRLDHPAQTVLSDVFAHYVGNQPRAAASHFAGLREAKPGLRAFALFDRRDHGLPVEFVIHGYCWRKREIENYVASRDALLRFASGMSADDAESGRRRAAMMSALTAVESAQATLGKDAWGDDIKTSEEVLPNVFRLFYKNLGLRNEMNKADYHELVAYLRPEDIDPEVAMVLDQIERELCPSA